MNGFLMAVAAAQAFSVTVPPKSAILVDGKPEELPVCTTVVNNGLLVIRMPDGARFVDDASERPAKGKNLKGRRKGMRRFEVVAPVEVATPIDAAAARDLAQQAETQAQPPAKPVVVVRITHPGSKGLRIVTDAKLPLASGSSVLSGGWKTTGTASDGTTHLEGETLSLLVEGNAPVARYTRGGRTRTRKGRSMPTSTSVDVPLLLQGGRSVSTGLVNIDGTYTRVRVEATVTP